MRLETLPWVPVRLFGGPLDGDERRIDPRWLPNVLFPLLTGSEAYLDRFDHPVRPTAAAALYSFGDRHPPEAWLCRFGYIPLQST